MPTPNVSRPGEEFHDDVRKRLPPDVLARYTRIDPLRSTCAVAQTFLLIALAVGLTLRYQAIWTLPLAVVFIATQQHALFVLAHDAAHYRLYGARWVNDLVGRLCGTVGGVSMCTYRVIHRLHHNDLYGPQDPDIALHGGYPRGRAYLLKKLGKDLLGLTAWKTYAYFFGTPAINADGAAGLRPLNDTSPRLRAAARQDRWEIGRAHV